jgi:hypothetical protein
MNLLAPLLAAQVLALQGPDGDDRLRFGFQGLHFSAAAGPAFEEKSLRGYFDAGLMAGWFTRLTSRTMFPTNHGWLLGPSVVTGFGASPTSFALEVGYGENRSIIGNSFTIGPLLRTHPEVSPGLSARVTYDFFFVQAGLRLNATFAGSGEVLGMIGLGRF